jgi:hypothetical protein
VAPNGAKPSWYTKAGRTIRVVHGAGEGLTTVEDRFKEPPTAPKADIVICAGAMDQGVPGSIMGKGSPCGYCATEGWQWVPMDHSRGGQVGARTMTEVLSMVQVTMQNANYRTWDVGAIKPPAVCFEDEASMSLERRSPLCTQQRTFTSPIRRSAANSRPM